MESCRPAIIVSFGVTAHCSPLTKGVTVSEESIPGRVSWVIVCFTIRNTSLGPPSKGGRAVAI